jgi:predicted Fe-S protein YdhL (DUF1289 family)
MTDTDETIPPSPCVGICIVGAEGFCIGCYRTREELQAWWTASPAEKRAIIARCRERAEREGPPPPP